MRLSASSLILKISPIMPHFPASETVPSEDFVLEDDVLPDAPEQGLEPAKEEGTDVKLEDLFNDASDDEDGEFSGTGISNTISGSSPPAPL